MSSSTGEQVRAVFLAALMVLSVVAMTTAFAGSAAAQQEPGNDTVHLLDETGSLEDTFTGNQAIVNAVNNASEGYTIKVGPGTYQTENRNNIYVETNNLSIIGVNKPAIDFSQSTTVQSDDQIFRIEADNTTIDGFEIVGDDSVVSGVFVAGGADNVTVVNNTIRGMAKAGGGGPSVWSWGILTQAFRGDGDIQGFVARNNTIKNIGGGSNADSVGIGIELFGVQGDSPGAGAVIKNNDINGLTNGPDGLDDSTDTTKALAVQSLDRAGDPGTEIRGNSLSGADIGMSFGDSDSSTVKNNKFANNPTHVYISKGSLNLSKTLTANTFDRVVTVEDASGNLTSSIYGSIQPAVDAASSGETVTVGPGTYNESVSISTANVTLKSTAGADATTIDIGSNRIGVADNATINGFSIVFDDEGIYTKSDNVSVLNNHFELADGEESIDYATRFGDTSSDGVVRNNEFVGINNTIDDKYGNGVVVAGPDGHVIVGNNFTYNSIGVNIGSQAPAGELKIKDNTFTQQDNFSIALNHDVSESTDFDIVNNQIESSPTGILVLSGGDIDIHSNNIVDITNYGISPTVDVNATSNWWGTESGPAEAVIDGDVTVDPWLDGPADEGGELRIAATVGDTGYSSIQSAVDAAGEDGTVTVLSGEYEESITIDESGITVEGQDDPVIVGDGVDSGSDPHATIHIDDSSGAVEDVTIDGLTLQNPNGSYGIYAGTGTTNNDADGVDGLTIQNSTIEEIATARSGIGGSSGTLAGSVSGIYVRADYGSESAESGLEIDHNRIQNVSTDDSTNAVGISLSNFIGNAAFADEASSPAAEHTAVTNNTVTDIRGGSGSRTKGISASGEFEEMIISDNTVSNISAPVDDSTILAISLTENSATSNSDIDSDGTNERIGPRDFVIRQNEIGDLSGESGRISALFVGGYEDLGTHTMTGNDVRSGSVSRVLYDQNGFDREDADILNAPLNYWGNDSTPRTVGQVVYDPVLTTSIENLDDGAFESEGGFDDIREYGSVLELESDGEALAVGFPAPPNQSVGELFADVETEGNLFVYENGEGYESVNEDYTPSTGEVVVITNDGIDEDVVVPVDTGVGDTAASPTSVDVENGWNLVATGAAADLTEIEENAALNGVGTINDARQLQAQPEQPGLPVGDGFPISTETLFGAYEGTWLFVDGNGEIATGYAEDQNPREYNLEILAPEREAVPVDSLADDEDDS
jgi:surface glycoprotein (TIGR04207 family)